MGYGLLRGEGWRQRCKKEREGEQGEVMSARDVNGMTWIGLGVHVLLSEPDGRPRMNLLSKPPEGLCTIRRKYGRPV